MGTRVGSIQPPKLPQEANLVIFTRSWQEAKRIVRRCKVAHISSLNPMHGLSPLSASQTAYKVRHKGEERETSL